MLRFSKTRNNRKLSLQSLIGHIIDKIRNSENIMGSKRVLQRKKVFREMETAMKKYLNKVKL